MAFKSVASTSSATPAALRHMGFSLESTMPTTENVGRTRPLESDDGRGDVTKSPTVCSPPVRAGTARSCPVCGDAYELSKSQAQRLRKGLTTTCSRACGDTYRHRRFLDPEGRKRCTGCSEWLDLSCFGVPKGRGRVEPRCRPCTNLRQHRALERQDEAAKALNRERSRAYRIQHREEIRARKAAWLAANPGRRKGYDAAWAERHPDRQAHVLLTPAYIASKLGLRVGQMPAALYEAAKVSLQITRQLKDLKQ